MPASSATSAVGPALGVAVLAATLVQIPGTGRTEPVAETYGFGRSATEAEIKAWDIEIAPDGAGLPPGRGTVQQGRQTFQQKCAVCHGQSGREGPMNRLVDGQGTLETSQPLKTVGSYWPHATTLFDYIRRAMPFTAPQSLSDDEVYGLVAWLLYQNGIIPEDAVMTPETLPAVRMPNRDGFVADPRPDVAPR